MSNYPKLADGIDLSKPLYSYTGFEFKQLFQDAAAEFIQFPSLSTIAVAKKTFLTKKEACEALGNISLVTLDRLTKERKITAYRPSPDRVVFCTEELEQYVFSTKAA